MIQYCFTGKVGELKNIGYKFEKLYAANHKSYIKENIFMFVVSKMSIEIKNFEFDFQVELISFILKNKNKNKSFWVENRVINTNPPMPYQDAPIWVMTRYGNIINHKEYTKGRADYMQKFKKILDLGNSLTEKEMSEKLDKLDETEFAREGFMIKYTLVKQILELNELHPLEKINII